MNERDGIADCLMAGVVFIVGVSAVFALLRAMGLL